MELLTSVFLLLVGFVLLIRGADFFVDGSSSIAKLIGIPGFVVGLTVVAMGTSAPEAAVSITAGLKGSNEIAISNVVGSNIFNLLVVAGVCAIIKPYKIEGIMLKRDFPVNIAISGALLVMMLLRSTLGLVDGLLLLLMFLLYNFIVIWSAFKNRDAQGEDDEKKLSPMLSVLAIVGGLTAVILGGQLVVNNATAIAKALGLSETFIGLTIIAIGTSLPELVTSIVAAKKGESGLALGNVIGSNIFNILLILGLSSSLSSIAIDSSAVINVMVMTVVTALVFIPCFIKKGMGRVVGALSVLTYVGYTVYLLINAAA